jgi:hypothetical protein
MKSPWLIAVLAVALSPLMTALPARADTHMSIPINAITGHLGVKHATSYGQTFKAPAGHVLDRFTFWLEKNFTSPDPLQVEAYVMAWDGQKATGPVLYESAVTSVDATHLVPFTFATGGTPLIAGGDYVAFVSVSGLVERGNGFGEMGTSVDSAYTEGDFFIQFDGDQFDAVTTRTWEYRKVEDTRSIDAGFEAKFSAISSVPEPAGLALLTIGALPLLRWRRRPQSV